MCRLVLLALLILIGRAAASVGYFTEASAYPDRVTGTTRADSDTPAGSAFASTPGTRMFVGADSNVAVLGMPTSATASMEDVFTLHGPPGSVDTYINFVIISGGYERPGTPLLWKRTRTMSMTIDGVTAPDDTQTSIQSDEGSTGTWHYLFQKLRWQTGDSHEFRIYLSASVEAGADTQAGVQLALSVPAGYYFTSTLGNATPEPTAPALTAVIAGVASRRRRR
jgi:hypothetical protein